MKMFSSLAAVMALWLAVSFLIWLVYRIVRGRDGSKQKRLASAVIAIIDEGAAIFSGIRTRASLRVNAQGNYSSGRPEDLLRDDVRMLLNGIEAQSPYFERVNVLKKKIQNTFDVPDFQALSEILQIRRDFWAASEIFLMDGIQELGPELADAHSLENFEEEAKALLFADTLALTDTSDQDPVKLRLSIAKEDALAFQASVEQAIAAELEKSRFPTVSEIAAGPLGLIKGTVSGLREIRYLMADAAVTAQSILRAMSSRGLKGAAEELRRVRADMPEQFATAFERAGGLARQGGQGLKRHYEFVIEAQELRARYAELLARAPNLSDKGKQFLTRLELEKRAEQFKETSDSLFDAARQGLVVGIAYLIAGLQYVQAKVTPAEHKQLAPLPAMPAAAPAPAEAPETPLRVLLLPASSYSGGNFGQSGSPARGRRRPKTPVADPRPKASPDEIIAGIAPKSSTWLRDFVSGHTDVLEEERPAKKPASKPRKPAKPKVPYSEGLQKMSFKDLLSVEKFDEDLPEPHGEEVPPHPTLSPRGEGFSSVPSPLWEEDYSGVPSPLGEERYSGVPSALGEKDRMRGSSLLNRLASLDEEKPPAMSEGTRSAPTKKTGWRLFGSKRS
jgi:hypothetical protein